MLELRNLVDVLEGDLATIFMARIHRTAQSVLPGFDISRVQQEVGGGRGAEFKGEGSVRADGDTRGDRDAGVDVSCAGVEFLEKLLIYIYIYIYMNCLTRGNRVNKDQPCKSP